MTMCQRKWFEMTTAVFQEEDFESLLQIVVNDDKVIIMV